MSQIDGKFQGSYVSILLSDFRRNLEQLKGHRVYYLFAHLHTSLMFLFGFIHFMNSKVWTKESSKFNRINLNAINHKVP